MSNVKVPIELNISINDDVIGFIEKEPGKSEIESYGEVRLPKGVIKKGYIKEPLTLVEKIESIYSSFKIRAKTVRWVLNEQNAILREIEIDKGELQNQNVEEYIMSQVGKTIHFPFETPIFNHFIKMATDETVIVTLFIIDEQMINDYLDVFDRLKIKDITYEIPMLALFRLYYTENEGEEVRKTSLSQVQLSSQLQDIVPENKIARIEEAAEEDDESDDDLIDGLMLVTLYDTFFTISIFSKIYPALFMMEDIESAETVPDTIDNYISRIASYYKHNRCGGKKDVKNVVCFNLSSIDDKKLTDEMAARAVGIPFEVFDLGEKSKYYKRLLPKGCYIPLAASFYKTKEETEE